MMWKSHRLFNAVAATGAAAVVAPHDPAAAVLIAGGVVATATLPDIDIKIPGLPHRGPATHSLLACIVFALVCMLLIHFIYPAISVIIDTNSIPVVFDVLRYVSDHAVLLGAALGFGCLVHILGDLPSLSGVPILWPIVRGDVHIAPRWGRFRVGGKVEKVGYKIGFPIARVVLVVVWAFMFGGSVPSDVEALVNRSSCETPDTVQKLVFSEEKYPNIMRHKKRAVRHGWPKVLVLNRDGADERRDKAVAPYDTKDGYDRDEYPPAVGRKKYQADVMLVPSSENRSHGAVMGDKLEPYCDGTRFRYVFR